MAKKTTKPAARKTLSRTTKAKTRTAATKTAPAPPAPRTITPYLAVSSAAEAITWYTKVLGGKETARQMAGPNKILHASIRVGDADIFLSDSFSGSELPDATRSVSPVMIHVYSKNINKIWDRAVANGAKVLMPIDNMFWGDRYGQFQDPFGHRWAVNHPVKMSAAEKETKRVEAMKQMAGAPPA